MFESKACEALLLGLFLIWSKRHFTKSHQTLETMVFLDLVFAFSLTNLKSLQYIILCKLGKFTFLNFGNIKMRPK